jgi:hypothetical protein
MIYRHHLLRAFLSCLWLAVVPMLSQCGGTAGIGTETGNPPGIVQQKLYLEVVSNGIRVVGGPGAIVPAAAAVRVTNVSTGVSVETIANADGSLDLVVAGAPNDEFEVRVTSDGQQVSEPISFVEMGRRSDLAGVSCQSLEGTLNQTIGDVFDSADTACTSTADCGWVGWGFGCYFQCGQSVLSRAGAEDVPSIAEAATATVCAALAACERPPPSSCGGGVSGLAACRDNRCQAVEASGVSCPEILQAASDRREQLRVQADHSCSVDADCRLASLAVRCLVSCDIAVESVSLSAAADLEARVRWEVQNAICEPAREMMCTAPDGSVDCPPSAAAPEAFCDAGACAVRYVE